jgi:hypothetical protein
MENKEVLAGTFGVDTAYFNANSPVNLVQVNADIIRGKTVVRLLTGDKDFLFDLVNGFDKKLTDLKIEHQYAIAKGADHDYRQVISKLDFNSFLFWKIAFSRLN